MTYGYVLERLNLYQSHPALFALILWMNFHSRKDVFVGEVAGLGLLLDLYFLLQPFTMVLLFIYLYAFELCSYFSLGLLILLDVVKATQAAP